MVEPVGITLASVGLFLQVFDVCDRLYHGAKLTWRFGTDFELIQIALEVQWARLDTIVRKRRIKVTEIDVDNPDHYVTFTIKRLLESMKIHFERCNQLMAWYDGESKSANRQGGSRD
jgi:Prion-inhibition and propagation